MPKQLITIVGLIVSLGVVALGVLLVAMPLWVQSLGVDAQTSVVANTNVVYEAQVAALEAEKERQAEIDASVASLRQEIPATYQLDDVFEVIGRAADASAVTITSATAGEPAAFVERTSAMAPGEVAEPVAAPDATEDATAGSTDDAEGEATAGASDGATEGAAGSLSGRQQVDFTILVTANDMAQATAFLDALRAGPRLLSSITAITTQTGTAVEVQVSALTFVDSEGVVAE